MSLARIFACITLFSLWSAPCFAREAVVLTWQECVKEAARNNPQIAASLERVSQRESERRVAASPMLPSVSAEAGVSRFDTLSGGGSRDRRSYSARGSQLLFDGFKTYNEFKSAEQEVAASGHMAVSVSADARYRLRRAFVDLMRAQALVPVTGGIIDRRRENLRMIELRYESGREHEGALLLAKADLAQAEYDNSRAKREISASQYALRKELGWSSDIPVIVRGEFQTLSPAVGKPDLREIASEHPAVKRAVAERGAAKHGVAAAKAEFFPRLDLSAEVGRLRSGGLFGSEDGWQVGLNASLPIFEGGRRMASTSRARARLLEVSFNETHEYDTALSTLEEAWQRLADAVEYCEVQKKFLNADEVRAKIARAQYANGLLGFDNWIIIEDNYVRSQKSYIAARADMLIAEAEWMRARGEALEL